MTSTALRTHTLHWGASQEEIKIVEGEGKILVTCPHQRIANEVTKCRSAAEHLLRVLKRSGTHQGDKKRGSNRARVLIRQNHTINNSQGHVGWRSPPA